MGYKKTQIHWKSRNLLLLSKVWSSSCDILFVCGALKENSDRKKFIYFSQMRADEIFEYYHIVDNDIGKMNM